jgi:hypothetical protein
LKAVLTILVGVGIVTRPQWRGLRPIYKGLSFWFCQKIKSNLLGNFCYYYMSSNSHWLFITIQALWLSPDDRGRVLSEVEDTDVKLLVANLRSGFSSTVSIN